MRSGLSFDQIFPIRNDASARLMRAKADCLFHAGVIDAADRSAVYARAHAVLGLSDFGPLASFAALAGQAQPARIAQ